MRVLLVLLTFCLHAARGFASEADEGDMLGEGRGLMRRLQRIERDVVREGGFADDEVEDGVPDADGAVAGEPDPDDPDAADTTRTDGGDRDPAGEDGEAEEREQGTDEALRELEGVDGSAATAHGAQGVRGTAPLGGRHRAPAARPRGAGRNAAPGERGDGRGTGGQAPSAPPAAASDDDEVP